MIFMKVFVKFRQLSKYVGISELISLYLSFHEIIVNERGIDNNSSIK